MAKPTGKQPDEAAGVPAKQIQIPEAGPKIPNPGDTIAISLPKRGANPLGKPPAPSPKADFDPDNVTRTRANVLSPTLTLTRPALGRCTSAGTDLVGDCAIANGLGIRQPVKMLVGFSEDYRWCFLMPVHHTTPKSIEVTYNKGVANINLWRPFEGLNKIVEKGYRESYELWMTEEPVEVHKVKGYALYFSMETFETESVSARDGVTPVAGRSTKSTTAKQKSTGQAPDSTTTPEDSDDETITQDDFLIMADALAEKDAQIKALQAQLDALKPKPEGS